MGQLSNNEVVVNAGGNVTSMVLSFLGGIWIPLEFVGSQIAAIARFNPVFYYSETVTLATKLQDFSVASLMPLFANIGIILLFAVAILSIALMVGKVRSRSYDAGGNAAAARPAAS
jgi:ABC-2 type transport system permease protein